MEIHLGGVRGALEPPADLLITNPNGQRTGFDPSTRTIVRDMPEGVGEYGRERIEAGTESVTLSLRNPEEGTYRLTLTGVRQGEFWLGFSLDDNTGKFAHKLITGQTDRGRIYRYRIVYSQKNSANTLGIPETYQFEFLPPLRSEGVTVVRAGDAVPARFRLKDSEGKIAPRVMASVTLEKIKGDVPKGESIEPPSQSPTARGNGIRYNSKTDIYSFELRTKTLSVGKWKVIIHLEDGAEHAAFFELR